MICFEGVRFGLCVRCLPIMVCVNVGIVVDKNGCCAGNGAKKLANIRGISTIHILY